MTDATTTDVAPTGPSITVLVADDQAIIRDGLVTVLSLLDDISVVGEASDGEQAVRLADELNPAVVLMDLRMPVLDGAAATARITSAHPGIAILILTTFADDDSIMTALRAGARGYLTKDAGRAEVASAIRAVAAGQSTFSSEIGALLVNSLTGSSTPAASLGRASSGTASAGIAAPDAATRAGASHPLSVDALGRRFPVLTQRELQVLALVGEGMNNHEIAASLYIGVVTVKTHINAIFSKLDLRDRAQAITLVRS